MTRDELCGTFLDRVTFALYPYQEEALLAWFEPGDGLMVCAPTGMGKTLLAEAALFEALHTRRRMYYTTPLIALTDQKFREMQRLAEGWGFQRDDIGLITGNRVVNPGAVVRVVVAEILLNHLLSRDPAVGGFEDVDAVVMDEFHSFNDIERGIVWELSLVLMPRHVRVMLLSATVGNPNDFARWLHVEHGRNLRVILSQERRVPLEFLWVEDKLLTEQLTSMVADTDEANRSPALVFCFNRDECWDVAERMKGLPIISNEGRDRIADYLEGRREAFVEGVGPKLRQMLVRGVGVHHAGVLPRHKEIVEDLFGQKLIPFVICTETLAAGINLPARSVVMTTLLKGKRGEKKPIPASTAHQIFGRAGRPQFDTKGYVYAAAHDDDVKIHKWKKRFEQIDPHSKDPNILRMRRDMERKKPARRTTEQYWTEGQFKQLIQAGPAKLLSRSMIPYQVLIFLLTRTGTLHETREFLRKRFNTPERIDAYQRQLDFMLDNLAALGYLARAEDGDHVTLNETIQRLLTFRSIDPIYGDFLAERLNYGDFNEKLIALESVLECPVTIMRHIRLPDDLPQGPLQREILQPLMIQMGVVAARPAGAEAEEDEYGDNPWEEEQERPPTLPEMLKIVFQSRLAAPEEVFVQPKWAAGAALAADCDFFRFVKAHNLIKQEGLMLRHLLRLVILTDEFFTLTQDPEYQRIGELATKTCRSVDPTYTDRFIADAKAQAEATAAALQA